jgi:Na+(H+)/acetate symporter ActP
MARKPEPIYSKETVDEARQFVRWTLGLIAILFVAAAYVLIFK